jgi:hypothetical protein
MPQSTSKCHIWAGIESIAICTFEDAMAVPGVGDS